MSTPDPIIASKNQPLLPPTPWWKSEVQFRGAIALALQVVSIIMRYVEIPWLAANYEKLSADLSQLVAMYFAFMALKSRQQSPIQPLTFTTAGAERKAESAQMAGVVETKNTTTVPPPATNVIFALWSSLLLASMLTGCVTVDEGGKRYPDAVEIACKDNPSEYRREQCAYALYGRFITFQRLAVTINESPATDDATKRLIRSLDLEAKPLADSVLDVAIDLMKIRREVKAGTSTEEELAIIEAKLDGWLTTAYPKIINLIEKLEEI